MRLTTRRVNSGRVTTTLTAPRIPALKRLARNRQYTLPILLVFTFTTLVLSVIYAYCVAKSHDSTDTSLFGKRYVKAVWLPSLVPRANNGQNVTSLSPSDGEREGQGLTALFFYTITLPFCSLVHVSTELMLHLHCQPVLSSRRAHIVSMTTTLALLCGWIITASFWIHCELPGHGNPGVCPSEVRGHFMYGIHEVSIAKASVTWIIIVLYGVHAGFVATSMKACRRLWKLESGEERGDAKETVIGLKNQKGEAVSTVKAVV